MRHISVVFFYFICAFSCCLIIILIIRVLKIIIIIILIIIILKATRHAHLLSSCRGNSRHMERLGHRTRSGDWPAHHNHHRRCHGNSVSVPAPVHGPSTGERGRLPKHNPPNELPLQPLTLFFNIYAHRHNNNNNNNNSDPEVIQICRPFPFAPFSADLSRDSGLHELFCGSFFQDLGHRISQVSVDSREASYLFQRIAVTTQRFNSVLFRDSFVAHESQDDSDA